MSSYFFAGQPAASAVARGLIGSGANDPVISDEPRRRPTGPAGSCPVPCTASPTPSRAADLRGRLPSLAARLG